MPACQSQSNVMLHLPAGGVKSLDLHKSQRKYQEDTDQVLTPRWSTQIEMSIFLYQENLNGSLSSFYTYKNH